MTDHPLAGEWNQMRSIEPRSYTVARARSPIRIDGRLDDPAWRLARWSDGFVDIQGSRQPAPRFRTRLKMLWDDQFLYIAAELEDPHVVATLLEKNSILYNDNNFEIFIDPDGDHHDYYEFEMNAHNTIWELTLPRPYKDGGQARLGTNLPGLQSAVRVEGTKNDPSDRDKGWTLEVAVPWKELSAYNPGRATPPHAGDVWRMNFSRVQWRWDVVDGRYLRHSRERSPADNWVWSPQGIIDMHRPERWGYVRFAAQAPAGEATLDPTHADRNIMMEIYHRQRGFRKLHGRWATHLAELDLPESLADLRLDGDNYSVRRNIRFPDGSPATLRLTQDSRLVVE